MKNNSKVPQVVKIKTLENYEKSLGLPKYETEGAAGADIKACIPNQEELVIKPGERILIPTGISMEIPFGFEIQVRPRSGVSYKTSLMILNSPGTIDSDYRGELKIIIGNLGLEDQVIRHGDRIAQIALAPVIQATFISDNELSDTERGAKGFGSTGR